MAGTVAVVALGLTAYSTYEQMQAQDEAAQKQKQAADEQRKARDEEKAAQAAQAAAERRQQIREERMKRAKIIQASTNAGVSMSSGEAGGVGGLATQLGSNIGMNLGMQQASNNISNYNQSAADFLSSANSKINEANKWGAMAGLSMSIFSASGGFGAFKSSPATTPGPASGSMMGPPSYLKNS
ncbi:MAG TPA: hypothetical protein VFM18_22010 [Methanosarcina sp.]|nr:hypothetical protein [Methanosarcina sp.]